MTRCYADGSAHEFPVEDETGAHCPEHGVTLLWRDAPAGHEPPPVTHPGGQGG
ncbi:hypothetical protein ABZ069_33970 [Streptomyces microflavus]|uniref:hypothetical protein n=1 Tax=Streptomyces microflavus TaxID=1919 RepID=UPI0033AB34AD